MKDKVTFLARAFNDIDCRIPLLLEFAKDDRYISVEILGIPSNVGISDPRTHDLSDFLIENGIRISNIYENTQANILIKLAYAVYIRLSSERLRKLVFKCIAFFSRLDKKWMARILDQLDSSIVMIDEIIYHPGRSFFVDELVKRLESKKISIYSFLSGQNPYLDLWHDKKFESSCELDSKIGVPFLLPSKNDRDVMIKELPNESLEVVGNTRFDISWVKTLDQLSSKRASGNIVLSNAYSKKIVFMLSKIEYGVELENIVEAMNACAALDESCVIVKPHTRGMSILELGDKLDSRIYDGSAFASSDLIAWSDTIMFTGSSIAIQAIQLGKQVIFLGYCQQYKSIYDNGKALLIANGLGDIIKHINSAQQETVEEASVQEFLTEHVYAGQSSGMVCKHVKDHIESAEKKD